MPAFALSYITPDSNDLICVVTAGSLQEALPMLKEKAVADNVEQQEGSNDPFTVRDWLDVKFQSQPNYRGCFPLLNAVDVPEGDPIPEFYDDAYHIEEVPHFVVS